MTAGFPRPNSRDAAPTIVFHLKCDVRTEERFQFHRYCSSLHGHPDSHDTMSIESRRVFLREKVPLSQQVTIDQIMDAGYI